MLLYSNKICCFQGSEFEPGFSLFQIKISKYSKIQTLSLMQQPSLKTIQKGDTSYYLSLCYKGIVWGVNLFMEWLGFWAFAAMAQV